jgi:hypothetical protein
VIACTALVLPPYERQMRSCGQPATYRVGTDERPRCRRHAAFAARRGERVERLGAPRPPEDTP